MSQLVMSTYQPIWKLHDELATYCLLSKLSRAVYFLHCTRLWILSTRTGDEDEILC